MKKPFQQHNARHLEHKEETIIQEFTKMRDRAREKCSFCIMDIFCAFFHTAAKLQPHPPPFSSSEWGEAEEGLVQKTPEKKILCDKLYQGTTIRVL